MIIPERYARQALVSEIGEAGQQAIRQSRVVVIGLGALGSNIANILARAGVGSLCLVDRDFVDWTNLQRQGLYEEEDAANSLPKAVAAKNRLARINSEVDYEVMVDDVNSGNVEKIISGATVVLDGLDNFYTRALINEACVKMRIPWIYGGCIATYGSTATFVPGITPCFNCLFPGVSGHTSPFTCDTVGVLGPIAFMVAAWEASEALKILVGKQDQVSRGLTFIELWHNSVTIAPVERLQGCPVCEKQEFNLLNRSGDLMTTSLCGRKAVQVVPAGSTKINFELTLETLSKIFQVEHNAYLLRFRCGEYEIVLFRDGRAIVFGTEDPQVARSLYGRYIGG